MPLKITIAQLRWLGFDIRLEPIRCNKGQSSTANKARHMGKPQIVPDWDNVINDNDITSRPSSKDDSKWRMDYDGNFLFDSSENTVDWVTRAPQDGANVIKDNDITSRLEPSRRSNERIAIAIGNPIMIRRENESIHRQMEAHHGRPLSKRERNKTKQKQKRIVLRSTNRHGGGMMDVGKSREKRKPKKKRKPKNNHQPSVKMVGHILANVIDAPSLSLSTLWRHFGVGRQRHPCDCLRHDLTSGAPSGRTWN